MKDGITPEDTHLRSRPSEVLTTTCVECRSAVDVDVRHRAADGPRGSRGVVMYADTDIVVWSCPVCRTSNADTFTG